MRRTIFPRPPPTVDELREGLSGGSFGKGSTAEQGEASALMEAMERYSGIFQGDEIRVTRRFTDFPPGDAIAPNDVMLFSDAQFARDPASITDPIEARTMPDPFDPSAKIEWSPVWSLRDQRFRYLPTSLLYFFYRGPGADQRGFQRLRGRQHARGGDRPGLPRAGGAGLPTPSGGTIACNGRKWTSTSSTTPTSAICEPSLPKTDAGFGCSTSPMTWGFRASWRCRTG